MAKDTPIEWTRPYGYVGATWNVIVAGCKEVSPGCLHCYAAEMALRRLSKMPQVAHYYTPTVREHNGKAMWTGEITINEAKITEPLTTRKPTCYFVNSMGDWAYDLIPFEVTLKMFETMLATPRHIYQLLTKRPGNAVVLAEKLLWHFGLEKFPKHIWFGVSVEDQKLADERRKAHSRMAELAAVTFVSYEPALEHVDWAGWEFLNWMIAGGESGANARPVHPDAFRAARDWAVANHVAFFFKQWGETLPMFQKSDFFGGYYIGFSQSPFFNGFHPICETVHSFAMPDHEPPKEGNFPSTDADHYVDKCGALNYTKCVKFAKYKTNAVGVVVGKKKAGRLLDGRVWNEYPTP